MSDVNKSGGAKKSRRKNFFSYLGGTFCSWSLTSSTKVPNESPQLSSRQVTPRGQPRQAMAKGRARTPAPTIEVKLCCKKEKKVFDFRVFSVGGML